MFTLRGYPRHSLRASSPILASEASLVRTRERARGRSLARSRETRFTRPNRRACSQAVPDTFLVWFYNLRYFFCHLLCYIFLWLFQVLYIPYSQKQARLKRTSGELCDLSEAFEELVPARWCAYIYPENFENLEAITLVQFSGAPNDGFLPNALKTLFRQCRVLCILSALKKFMSVRSS